MRNDKFFPETSQIQNEIVEFGMDNYKSKYGIDNCVDFINQSFQKKYSYYLKNGEYYPGCSINIFKKHYKPRLMEFLKETDSDEFQFIQRELTILKEIGFHEEYYNFQTYLYNKPYKQNLKVASKMAREFLLSKVLKELNGRLVLNSEYYEIYHLPNISKELQELSFWNFKVERVDPDQIDKSETSLDVIDPPIITEQNTTANSSNIIIEYQNEFMDHSNNYRKENKLNQPERPLPKNTNLKMYDIENEQGIYFPDDNLLYIDENRTNLIYHLVSRILLQKKEITEEHAEKLKELKLVKDQPFYTYLVKRFLYAKELPQCDCFTGNVLHIDNYEENLQKLQDWERQVKFIQDALAEDLIKQVILTQKIEDLINWQLALQTSRAYKEELSRILKDLSEKTEKSEKEKDKNEEEITRFGISESTAKRLYLEFLKADVINEDVDEAHFLTVLTSRWSQVEGPIKLKCKTTLFAFLIESIERLKIQDLLSLDHQNIERSQLFLTQSGITVTANNLSSSRKESRKKGSSTGYTDKSEDILRRFIP